MRTQNRTETRLLGANLGRGPGLGRGSVLGEYGARDEQVRDIDRGWGMVRVRPRVRVRVRVRVGMRVTGGCGCEPLGVGV